MTDLISNVSVVGISTILVMMLLVYKGYRNGMTKEFISMVRTIVLMAFLIFFVRGIQQFKVENYTFLIEVLFVFSIIMLFVKIGGVLIIPFRLVAQMAIIKQADKLLGIVVGIIKTILWLRIVSMVVLFLEGTEIQMYFKEDILKSELITAIIYNKYFEAWFYSLL